MSITIIPNELLVQGAFDMGRILERKPIGFPQDGGKTASYSTLFYWAHAWSALGGLIGEHPHRGFEIISFVLSGEIEHYDSAHQGWKKLQAGDVQVIQAGNGITHAEKILANSSIFQIWVDPDLNKTMGKKAAYRDYRADEFSTENVADMETRHLFGPGPMQLDAEVHSIREIHWKEDKHTWLLDPTRVYSFFVLEGSLHIDQSEVQKGAYVIIKQTEKIALENISTNNRVFLVETPLRPSYTTYAEMYL